MTFVRFSYASKYICFICVDSYLKSNRGLIASIAKNNLFSSDYLQRKRRENMGLMSDCDRCFVYLL